MEQKWALQKDHILLLNLVNKILWNEFFFEKLKLEKNKISDSFIHKTKNLYVEATENNSYKNLNKVTKELSDVHNIMSQSISEILQRGDKLERNQKKNSFNFYVIYHLLLYYTKRCN